MRSHHPHPMGHCPPAWPSPLLLGCSGFRWLLPAVAPLFLFSWGKAPLKHPLPWWETVSPSPEPPRELGIKKTHDNEEFCNSISFVWHSDQVEACLETGQSKIHLVSVLAEPAVPSEGSVSPEGSVPRCRAGVRPGSSVARPCSPHSPRLTLLPACPGAAGAGDGVHQGHVPPD